MSTYQTMPPMRTLLTMFAVLGLFVGFGCGDEEDPPPPAPDAPMGAPLTCATYCNQIMTNCTGANAQYPSMAQCMSSCGKLPLDGNSTDTMGNTLGCRIYHSGAPAMMTPATHCVHAGPAGNQISAANGATCGNSCESFCKLNRATCTGANMVYADDAACMAACNNFNKTATYVVDATNTMMVRTPIGDSLACRIYHTTNATLSDAAAMTHCPHTSVAGGPNQNTCMMGTAPM